MGAEGRRGDAVMRHEGETSGLRIDHAQVDRTTRLLRAISNEYRLAILQELARGETSVGALADRIGARQPTVSQVLSRLRTEDLVTARRDGRTIYYSINRPTFARLADDLVTLLT
jgi:DNA-binding transcriptional ArsR family regulator